jgi:hypothetical protein
MNLNTARAKSGTTSADDKKEVVDFAERLRYVLELKINKLRLLCRNHTFVAKPT